MTFRFCSTLAWFPAALVLLLPAVARTVSLVEDSPMEKQWVYVGTYTDGPSKGIYRFDFDPATGQLTNRALAATTANPSFLAIHPNHRFLYAVGELDSFNGKKTGAIRAFAIDQKTGDLQLLNQQSSGGTGPCHLIVDKAGRHVLAANYGGGSVCVLPIQADGRLGEATAVVQHHGSSVNQQRQKEPHAHSFNLDAANRFAFAADLGLDQVLIYRYDAAKGMLTPNDPPSIKLAPGSGPRHFAFHPSGRFAYVINELANTVTAMSYDADKGILKETQTVTTLPKDFKGASYTAEVVVHPSGKFLYGSNRGHNSIAVFTIDEQTGKLTPAGWQTHSIMTPRNFNVDPSGEFLLVANQDGNTIVVFSIDSKTGVPDNFEDPKTGAPIPLGRVAAVPKPVCVKLMPRPR